MPKITDKEKARRWRKLAIRRAELLREARVALTQIRDTAIAMDDAVRTYPGKQTVIGAEGPKRIKDTANTVLLS